MHEMCRELFMRQRMDTITTEHSGRKKSKRNDMGTFHETENAQNSKITV